MTPEGKVKAKVKQILKEYGVYYFMPVQTGYGGVALDFLCCHRGRFFAIETKAIGKKLTGLQEYTVKTIEDAGGTVFVIHSEQEAEGLRLFLSR